MGIGIIGVLIAHWFGFQGINSGVVYGVMAAFCKLVFTEGFLFLSGFGLYYSFSKNGDYGAFYKRRLMRLYLPFLILSLPVYCIRLIVDANYDLLQFGSQITTIYFWLKGNFWGMWYVSLSLSLYLIFPFLYRFMFNKEKRYMVITNYVIVMVVFILAAFLLNRYSPEYYETIKIGFSKIHMFFTGMLFAYLNKNLKISNRTYLLMFLTFCLIYGGLSLAKGNNYWIIHSCGLIQKLVYIPILCACFALVETRTIGQEVLKILSQFGKYSLELYILHLHCFLLLNVFHEYHGLSKMSMATITVLAALVFCVPVNNMISKIQNKLAI